MTVVRLELDVSSDRAGELANVLAGLYVSPARAVAGVPPVWLSARVTVLTDFEVQRERTLLAAAQYFYPPPPGGRGVSHGDGH
jgi:hypothetical protein